MKAASILLVEGEQRLRRSLRTALSGAGYRLFEARTGEGALAQAALIRPDLIVLEGLSALDGLVVTQRLRERASTPIIVISTSNVEEDEIALLDAGADDYVVRPFRVGELKARIRVALRHGAQTRKRAYRFSTGDLKVDFARRQVLVRGAEVHLTPIEYKLLAKLIEHAGGVLTHRELLRAVWGPDSTDQTQYLRVYMAQLRQKLEQNPGRPAHLLTEPGVGYRLRFDA